MEEGLDRGSIENVHGVECQVPQQKNPHDCGLYALRFTELFIEQAPNRMETEYTTMVRVDCCLPLIFKTFIYSVGLLLGQHVSNFQFGENWFPEEEVIDLRRRMETILTNLFNKETIRGMTKYIIPIYSVSIIDFQYSVSIIAFTNPKSSVYRSKSSHTFELPHSPEKWRTGLELYSDELSECKKKEEK